MSFFSSKPYDIVCLDSNGHIVASGSCEKMMRLAEEKNYGVAKLIPMKYAIIPRSTVPFLTDEEYESFISVTKHTNEEFKERYNCYDHQ